MKTLKNVGLAILILLILMQSIRPTKNTSNNKEKDISTIYTVPGNVQQILTKACNDCHSNNTIYPWYASVQPLAWWINDHVKDAKKHLNFNEFASYSIARQYKKLEECIDEIREGEMPLKPYTVIHKNAKLTDADKEILFNWFSAVRDTIKAKYPADSLVLKRK